MMPKVWHGRQQGILVGLEVAGLWSQYNIDFRPAFLFRICYPSTLPDSCRSHSEVFFGVVLEASVPFWKDI